MIDDHDDIAAGLKALKKSDPRLARVIKVAGEVPLRRGEGGFSGIADIVVAQQLSKAAAGTIWSRFAEAVDPVCPDGVLGASEEVLRGCGLSRGKIRTLQKLAEACRGGFDFDALPRLPAEEAIAAMTDLHGIGPWTAEVYLLFCVGHADIFPAGDVALQNAVRDAFDLAERPAEKALREMAAAWSPWRGVAARLFWRYYAVTKREATPAGA